MSGRRLRFPPFFLFLLAVFVFLARPVHALSTIETIKARGVLLWGCDISGGAPLAFVDPKDPSKLLGFEAEITEAIARELGVRSQVVQTDWDSLVPSLERGNYDMAMNGLEVTPERQKRVLLSPALTRKRPMTMLISTHEMGFAREVADRVVVLDNGDIVESGAPEVIFTSPGQERTKTFLKRILKNT